MSQLTQEAVEKIKGPAWDGVREMIMQISEELLSVSGEAGNALTTIYVKFTIGSGAASPVYAVMWLKTSKEVTVGLAMPEPLDEGLGAAPPRMSYKGITGYFSLKVGDSVPEKLSFWAQKAFQTIVAANEA